MDGTGRTLSNTFLTKLALCIVDVSEVVLNCNRIERTYLRTLATADACSLAGLACSSALVLVHA